ncbi:MAG: hypothetical protein KY475_07205, partial [Planctomycetes bacterium]|nr:hypothetical protein [Planctomycetota bacterium]
MLPVFAESEIEIYISDDGKNFRKWTLPIVWTVNIGQRQPELLAPNESRCYMRRVLVDEDRKSKLAFERPGAYWIKVVFPLVTVDPYERMEIQSPTLSDSILEPHGYDAEVWR